MDPEDSQREEGHTSRSRVHRVTWRYVLRGVPSTLQRGAQLASMQCKWVVVAWPLSVCLRLDLLRTALDAVLLLACSTPARPGPAKCKQRAGAGRQHTDRHRPTCGTHQDPCTLLSWRGSTGSDDGGHDIHRLAGFLLFLLLPRPPRETRSLHCCTGRATIRVTSPLDGSKPQTDRSMTSLLCLWYVDRSHYHILASFINAYIVYCCSWS